MAKGRGYRIIQVPIDEDLLRQIDAATDRVAESRAAYIREACRRRLRSDEAGDLDRQYVEGYRKKPEEPSWGRLGAMLLARRLPPEKW